MKYQPQITPQREEQKEGPAAACQLPPLVPIYQNDPKGGHAYISGVGHLACWRSRSCNGAASMASEMGEELATWGRPEALHGVFPSVVSLGGKGSGNR